MIDKIEPLEEPYEGELMKEVNRRWLEKCNEMVDTFNEMTNTFTEITDTFNSMAEKFEEWELEQERIQRLYG